MAKSMDDGRDVAALVALSRFGLGPRPGDLKRIASDPRGALVAELERPDVAALPDPYLVSSAQSARDYLERKAMRQLLTGREVKAKRQPVIDALRAAGRLPPETAASPKPASVKRDAAPDMAMSDNDMADNDMAGGDMAGKKGKDGKKPKPSASANARDDDIPIPAQPMDDEMAARFVRMRNADIGFVERLVSFWGDHLTVSVKGANYVRWIGGGYDREAIRPHTLGRFEDLLLASAKHSAMLHYLDNQASAGPNSEIGKRSGKGLNENYARELMELHTIGTGAGYSQADVIAVAKALTGWRVEKGYKAPNIGEFEFVARAHEPGDQTVLGKLYKDGGVAQGEAILRDLAHHPATAKRIAEKMAVAFVSDEQPPALVARLEKSFLDTGGDLKALARTLVTSDEAWNAPREKMRSPQEFVFAAIRLLDRQPRPELLMDGLSTLGQPLWGAPAPKGYSIYGRDWLAPDAQTNRLDLAVDLARDYAEDLDPNALGDDVLGAAMSDETRTAVKRAGSREQALALLLMSPEMQRR